MITIFNFDIFIKHIHLIYVRLSAEAEYLGLMAESSVWQLPLGQIRFLPKTRRPSYHLKTTQNTQPNSLWKLSLFSHIFSWGKFYSQRYWRTIIFRLTYNLNGATMTRYHKMENWATFQLFCFSSHCLHEKLLVKFWILNNVSTWCFIFRMMLYQLTGTIPRPHDKLW